MQQIKIFKSGEYRYRQLEEQVNGWLKANKVKVLSIFGNIAPQTGKLDQSAGNQDFAASDLLLIVHYETADAA